MSRLLHASLLAASLFAAVHADVAGARSNDRNQPMNIEAAKVEYSTKPGTPSVLEGGVVMTQGSMNAKSAHATVWQNNGKASRVLLKGSPVVLDEVLDDGTPLHATAAQVDYNLETEVAVFTGNVAISQPRGTMNGSRVTYNMKTGMVNSGGDGTRVRMVIQPKTTGAK